MNNHRISLRDLGIAILAPVCMVFTQDCISAIFQIFLKESRDTTIPVSLFSYTVIILMCILAFFRYPQLLHDSSIPTEPSICHSENQVKKAEMKNMSSLRIFILCILLLITGISIQLLSTGILNIIDIHSPNLLKEYKTMVEDSFSLNNGILRVATVTLVAPIAEELVFRGISLGALQRFFQTLFTRTTPYKYSSRSKYCNACAIFISALLFGLFHGNVVQFCYAVPSGIILALITVWTSSLLPAIFLHMTVNISSYMIDSIFSDLSVTAGASGHPSDTFFTAVTAGACLLCVASLIIIHLLLFRPYSAKADHSNKIS